MPTQNESAMAKRVRFIYVENACRSQMAEALLRHYGVKQFEVLARGHLLPKFTPWPLR